MYFYPKRTFTKRSRIKRSTFLMVISDKIKGFGLKNWSPSPTLIRYSTVFPWFDQWLGRVVKPNNFRLVSIPLWVIKQTPKIIVLLLIKSLLTTDRNCGHLTSSFEE